MRTHRSFLSRILLVGTLASVVGMFAASPIDVQGQAAQTPPREHYSVTIVSVKPDMTSEFEHFMLTETNPNLIKGGLKERDVWQTATFGNPAQYVIVVKIDNFAMYDSPLAMERALGADGFAAWRQRAGRYLNSVRVFAIETRPDMSIMGSMTALPNMAVVTNVHVGFGHEADFENFVKTDLLPLIKESGIAGYWVNKTMFGGDPNEYTTLALLPNYGELDKGPPAARKIGMEAYTKLFTKLPAGTIVSVERAVAKFRPDLSIIAGQAPK